MAIIKRDLVSAKSDYAKQLDGNIFEKGENNFFKWIQQKFRINFTATQQDLTNAKIDYKKQLDGNFQQF